MILIVASCFDKSGNNVVEGVMSGVKKNARKFKCFL